MRLEAVPNRVAGQAEGDLQEIPRRVRAAV